MCDQTELSYGDGDVVWVKIGPIWWPGVVKDISKEGKENEVLGGLKNKPIAIVQFFDEEKYEFVKNLENIYHYNCRRKDEFIKKGLDKFRSGAKHMVKFPEDVSKAEELVKGDVNIINDPKFAPQEKKNNYSELFGTPKKKTRKTEDIIKTKFLPLKKRLSAPAGRSVANGPGPSARAELSCPLCDFSANLVTTMSSHFLYFHSSQKVNYGNDEEASPVRRNVEPKRARPTPGPSKRRGRPSKPKQETHTVKTTEKSPKVSPVKNVVLSVATSEKAAEKKKRFTDALLADWSEDEDNKGEDLVNTTDLNENINVAEPVDAPREKPAPAPKPQVVETAMEVDEDNRNSTGSTEGTNDNDKRETSSCFDFDDEDDGFIGMSDAYTYGRKIPRVIPVKDKTDLGRDMEVDEVFRKKPDSESMDDENAESEEEPIKRKRGRQPKNSKAASPKKVAKPVDIPKTGLAATRQRRPGARKSYLNEVIEKIEDDARPDELVEIANVQRRYSAKKTDAAAEEVVEYEKIQEFEPEFLDTEETELEKPTKSSRRKQDLKSQKLMEYDDVESLVVAQKKQMELRKKMNKERTERNIRDLDKKSADDEERSNGANILLEAGKASNSPTSQKVDDSADDDLTAQVESLLAETTAPTVFSKVKSFNVLPKSPAVSEEISEEIEYLEDDPPMITSPVKPTVQASPTKKIKSLDLEQAIKKSAIPQWRQGIQESLKLNKEITLKEGIKKLEPGKTNIIKLSGRGVQPPQKGARYLILSPQQGIVSNSATAQRVCKVTTMPKTTAASAVNIDSFRQKIIKLSANTVQKKQLKGGEGYQMIKNFNGTGRTAVILKDVARKIMVTPEKKCYIQRKGPDGNITLKSIVSQKRPQQIVFNNQTLKFVPKPEAVEEPPIVEPVVEPVVAETVHQLPSTQQVILPATGDVQTTYMLVTVDGQTMLQPVDSSLLPYAIPEATTQLYETPAEAIKPVCSTPGQDILAEALANTNVLESEMPLMMPSVVQETCVTLQKPIMTPMEVPSNAIPDTSLLIAPVVQETSITLQKPIMTPLEVPTSIVTDASGLEPPPLPPTPTEEDVMMEDTEDALMIAEQPPVELQTQHEASQDAQHQGNFFIDDSQEEEEGNAFQSMPLLNEESTASEEHIADQNFDAQVAHIETNEYLPTSTNTDLEPEQIVPAEQETTFIGYRGDETEGGVATDEGFVVAPDSHSSQETEVSSTTGDSKDNVA